MTAEEVLEMWDDIEGDVADPEGSEDELEWDDPDEPIMEGSDDEFGDLWVLEESEEEDEDEVLDTPATPNAPSPPSSPERAANPTPVPTAVNLSASVPNPTTQPTSWSSTLHPVTINPFTSPVGPTVPISDSPLEVLELFFSADLMEKIIEESNRYANQVMGDERYNKWKKVTVEELKAFLGFHILMGIIHLPAVDDYWRRDPLLRYAPIADRITRDRFRELSRYLHFVDNDTLVPRDSPGYDRLGKVRPLIDHLSNKFEELYQPHREVADTATSPHTQHINFPNRGDSQVVQKGGVSACAWLDRKVVMAMFSNSQPSSTASVLRRQKDHTRTPVRCPESILLYNKYMGGVDRGDQLRGYYTCRTKSRKFYKYISFFLFDVAVTNAYVLQKNFCPENVHKNLKEFRLQLARELIGDYCNRRRAGRRPSQIITLPLRHFPIRIPGESQNTKFKRGRCAHCKVSHCRKDSTWFCRECEVWLCHSGDPREDCFLKWHTGREL